MKYWHAFLFYLGAFILQPFLYGTFPVIATHINLILCITVVFTFIYDDVMPGLFFGPIFGLINDAMYAPYIGPEAFTIAVVGVVIYLGKVHFNIENIFNAIITMLISTWLFASVMWVVYSFANSPYSYTFAMKELPLQLILNAIAGTILYSVLIKKIIKKRKYRYF